MTNKQLEIKDRMAHLTIFFVAIHLVVLVLWVAYEVFKHGGFLNYWASSLIITVTSYLCIEFINLVRAS